MIINKYTKLIICTAGIFVCYFYFGILLEKILRGQYGEGNNKVQFTYAFALVFVECVVNSIFAKSILMTVMKQGEDTTATIYYASGALTYLLGMVGSTMALEFVNYPTQVIGKAAKPIPVMVLGVLFGNKVYPSKKYAFILLIVIGVASFMYKDGVTAKHVECETYWFGELLLLLSLIMDGLTGAVEERMRSEHKTKHGHMMLNTNMWSAACSGVVILISGELFKFIRFLQKYPAVIWHITTLSLSGAVGQFFIFLTVSDFGPLPCSIITTTRKFFTVLGSIWFFENSFLLRQWVSTFIVFLGLFLDAMYG
ncbi:solute carrier family 35 member B1-like [Prorops nasuta]|uniref:solute carrier family 35 member B1-like n=1 Tax=Prorops nasuta TaxID=863751 RepID=UPI0034CD74AA